MINLFLQVDKIIGVGASGQVYKAVIQEEGKPPMPVALKQMNVVMKDMALSDPFLQDFLSEM